MGSTDNNVVKVDVTRSIKHPQFYFVQGPGGVILSLSPRFDPVTGDKDMIDKERYDEIEKVLYGNRHVTHPKEYQVVGSYQAPADFKMLSDLDMRQRTLSDMRDKITESTKS